MVPLSLVSSSPSVNKSRLHEKTVSVVLEKRKDENGYSSRMLGAIRE